jgi:hypothetical protein
MVGSGAASVYARTRYHFMRSRSGAPFNAASRGIEEILVSEGVITSRQLEEAYRLGRQQRQGVGRILLSLGHVGQSDLAKALARRLRLEFVELSVDHDVAGLVDKKLLRRYGMLPLRVGDGRLVVGMKDPANLHALEDLRMLSAYTIGPVVVAASDLRRVFGRLFGEGEEVQSSWRRHQPKHPRKIVKTWSCASTGAPRVRRRSGWSVPSCEGRPAPAPPTSTSSPVVRS